MERYEIGLVLLTLFAIFVNIIPSFIKDKRTNKGSKTNKENK